MRVSGKVLSKFGDDVSTDDMSSAKYVTSTKPEELGKICMRDLDPEFPQKMAGRGFLVAGKNFGCGSSREWAPVALKAAGVTAVLAEEFARIFYRNALNIGLALIECKDIATNLNLNDEVEIDLESGVITNKTKGSTWHGVPLPAFLLEVVSMGGLMERLKKRKAQG